MNNKLALLVKKKKNMGLEEIIPCHLSLYLERADTKQSDSFLISFFSSKKSYNTPIFGSKFTKYLFRDGTGTLRILVKIICTYLILNFFYLKNITISIVLHLKTF